MITCIGEALIDLVDGKSIVGGCPLNVSIAASRLGAPATFYGKFSNDNYGNVILNKLIDNCVIFDPLFCSDEKPTGTSEVTVVNGIVSYKFAIEDSCCPDIRPGELEAAFSNVTDIDVVFFGSLGTVLSPSRESIEKALSTLSPSPVLFYDPNCRPLIIKDREGFAKNAMKYMAQSHIVKLSLEDLEYLFPDVDTESAIAILRKTCMKNLILTKGGEGSVWYVGQTVVECPVYKAGEVADTVGCGDTFSGAVLAYLHENGLLKNVMSLTETQISQILSYASKAAGINSTRVGCNPPSSDEI